MDEVYSWIRNIVIYMILNTIIMNLLGNSSYKKYVSIVSGMILVLIVISPLMKLFDLEDDLEYYLGSNEQAAEALSFRKSLAHMEKKQLQSLFTDYEDKLKQQAKELLSGEGVRLTEFNAYFETDTESGNFGGLISMDVKAECINEETGSTEGTNKRIDIERIVLGGALLQDRSLTPLEINIKNKLSDFYNIEPANINISIQGG